MSVVDDLQAFLFLVPYAARRPKGVPTSELLEHLSMTHEELAGLLDRVASVGTPDGSPDELVEVYLEGDRVHVALPQTFEKPPRFSLEEALALLLVLAPLRGSPLPELSKHASRITEALLALSAERTQALANALRDAIRVVPAATDRPEHLELLERAVNERRAVDIEYYTASRDSLGARELRPWALFEYKGAWYVLSDERKTFKVARIRSARLTDRTFPPPPAGLDLERFRGRFPFGMPEEMGPGERPITIRTPEGAMTYPGPLGPNMRGYVRSRRGAMVVEPGAERDLLVREARALRARHAR